MRMEMRARTTARTSFKTKLVIGTSCCLLTATGIFVSLNFSNAFETYAASSGDYRNLSSGNWEDAAIWEIYAGNDWHPAATFPNNLSNKVFIKGNTVVRVNTELIVADLLVEVKGTLKLNHPKLHIFKGQFVVHGKLDAGRAVIDGNGAFQLKEHAEIIIGSADGLNKTKTGTIQTSGLRYYSSLAHYTYKSSTHQHTGKGLPASVSILAIENPSGVELDGNLFVTSALYLHKGTLNTVSDTLFLGTSVSTTATVLRKSGGISGNFKRFLNTNTMNEALFPLMEGANYHAINMTVKPEVYTEGSLTFSFVPGTVKEDEHPENRNTRILVIGKTGYYKVTAADGFENGIYKLVISVSISKNEKNSYWTLNARQVTADRKETPYNKHNSVNQYIYFLLLRKESTFLNISSQVDLI